MDSFGDEHGAGGGGGSGDRARWIHEDAGNGVFRASVQSQYGASAQILSMLTALRAGPEDMDGEIFKWTWGE
jgi:hypothetical protein